MQVQRLNPGFSDILFIPLELFMCCIFPCNIRVIFLSDNSAYLYLNIDALETNASTLGKLSAAPCRTSLERPISLNHHWPYIWGNVQDFLLFSLESIYVGKCPRFRLDFALSTRALQNVSLLYDLKCPRFSAFFTFHSFLQYVSLYGFEKKILLPCETYYNW